MPGTVTVNAPCAGAGSFGNCNWYQTAAPAPNGMTRAGSAGSPWLPSNAVRAASSVALPEGSIQYCAAMLRCAPKTSDGSVCAAARLAAAASARSHAHSVRWASGLPRKFELNFSLLLPFDSRALRNFPAHCRAFGGHEYHEVRQNERCECGGFE